MKSKVNINVAKAAPKILEIAKRGFCEGIGSRDSRVDEMDEGDIKACIWDDKKQDEVEVVPDGKGRMCVEAAVAFATGEKAHTDKPSCTLPYLADLKIRLNDYGSFKNDKDRAEVLKFVAIAQLGTRSIKVRRFKNVLFEVISERLMQAVAEDREAVETAFKKFIKDPSADTADELEAASMTYRKNVESIENVGDLWDVENYFNGKPNSSDYDNTRIRAGILLETLSKFNTPGWKWLKKNFSKKTLDKAMFPVKLKL